MMCGDFIIKLSYWIELREIFFAKYTYLHGLEQTIY